MIIINDEWCYIHIPKNSGTNLRKIFLRSSNKVDSFSYENPKRLEDIKKVSKFFWDDNLLDQFSSTIPLYKDVNLKWCHHASVFAWQQANILTTQKVFTICRNPFTRFISYCNNVIEKSGIFIPQMSLKEFIHSEYLHKVGSLSSLNYNYKTNQVDFLTGIDNKIVLDRVYKLESELNKIESDFSLTDINKHMYNRGNYERDYSKIYTDKTIKWVQNTFARDFYYFGYDIKPFW